MQISAKISFQSEDFVGAWLPGSTGIFHHGSNVGLINRGCAIPNWTGKIFEFSFYSNLVYIIKYLDYVYIAMYLHTMLLL